MGVTVDNEDESNIVLWFPDTKQIIENNKAKNTIYKTRAD